MRELKFRAWDKGERKMIEVNRLSFFPNIGWSYCVHCGLSVGISPSRFELMQYTGVKDKNGIDIYEGDILFGDAIVVYKSRGFFGITTGKHPLSEYSHHDDFEVVGNIYNQKTQKGGELKPSPHG